MDGAALLYSSDFGFQYTYPAGWTRVDTASMMPSIQMQQQARALTDKAKRAAACTHIGLLVTRSNPTMKIIIIELPYSCYGSSYQDSEVSTYGPGVLDGLGQQFDIGAPTSTTTYKLGKHSIWANRSHATLKQHPDQPYEMETVCTILSKAAVCWVAIAEQAQMLSVLEQGQVSLDGDPLVALVPPAFGIAGAQ